MSTLYQAAVEYQSAGWRLVALHPREKRPQRSAWQTGSEPLSRWAVGSSNVGIALGLASGGLVDLDLDDPTTVSLARALLAEEGWASFGRASSPSSHYIVRVSGMPPDFTRRPLRARQREGGPRGGEPLVDIRGNRHQTMFPPSVHPSGEDVRWELAGVGGASVEAAVERITQGEAVPFAHLVERAERVYALSLVARVWPPEGSRHDAAVALAGWMGHSGWSEQEARDGMLAVALAAGDVSEPGDRLAAVSSTYSRLAAGQQVQGVATLQSLLGEQAVAPAGALSLCSLQPRPSNLNLSGEQAESQGHVQSHPRHSEPSDRQNQADSAESPESSGSQKGTSAFSRGGLGTETPSNGTAEAAAASPEDAEASAFLRYADGYEAWLEQSGARLVWHEGEFWDYEQGAYAPADRGRVRSELRRAVAPAAVPATLGNVLSVLEDRLTIGASRRRNPEPPFDVNTGHPLEGGPFLVFRNGTVDLGTNPRLLFPHSSEQFHTRRIPHDYPEGGEVCPVWMQCLRDWFGERDEATPRMLAQWFGYVLSGDTSQERILSVVGAADAGKSTLAWTLEQLVGSDVVVPSTLSSIAGRFGLHSWSGKALAVFAEARTARRVDTSLAAGRILAISGRDTVELEKKNLAPIAVRLPARLMFISNKLPSIGDDTGAFHRRLLVVGFHRTLEPARRDPQLRSKLEAELPGILRWALRGLEDLHHNGAFAETEASRQARAEDLASLSPMRAWAAECLRFERGAETDTAALRESFAAWSERQGIEAITAHAFSRQFRDTFGLQPRRHRDRRAFGGVSLGV